MVINQYMISFGLQCQAQYHHADAHIEVGILFPLPS